MLRRRMFWKSRWIWTLADGFSGHDQFSESTEEIAPLTEEEKKQRLQELREALAEKRSKQSLVDKEEQKKNEVRDPSPALQPIFPIDSTSPHVSQILLGRPIC